MKSPARARRATAPSETQPGLSRERVCREALALVDEEGLDALSMRRLGARLGVEAMSLYRHVRDKDDLLDAIHAAVLGDLGATRGAPLPATADWRALLSLMATSLRAALLRHPNALPLFGTRPVRAAEANATIGLVRNVLIASGFPEAIADGVLKVVGVYTIGYVLSDAHHANDASAPRIEAFQLGLDALLAGLAVHATPPRRRARPAGGP
jgi:TetR/AcrR family transcriptional regulator, tetracycline repressor protein